MEQPIGDAPDLGINPKFIAAAVQTDFVRAVLLCDSGMLYQFGLGEVPISIVSDPEFDDLFDHTIRVVGRVTRAMSKLKPGDRVGVRGPYGHGWPLEAFAGHNIVLVTGGLGCAPLVSVIHYILNRRAHR